MTLERRALDVLSHLGVGREAMALYDSTMGAIDLDVGDGICEHASMGDTDTGVVLFSMIPGYKSMCYRYAILAHAFRVRGYRPVLVHDDGFLDAHPERTVDRSGGAATAQCQYYSERIPEEFCLETVGVGEVLGDDYTGPDTTKLSDGQYRDVDVSRFVDGSLRKRFKVYTLDSDDSKLAEARERYQRSGMVLVDAFERLHDRHDVVATVVHEPYYIQGGVPLEVASNNGSYGYSQMMGYQNGTLIFGRTSNRATLPPYTNDDLVADLLDRPLSETERNELDSIMESRRTGEGLKEYFTGDADRTIESDDKTLVGLFTNLLWDDSLGPETALYEDIYEWLGDTIDHIAQQDDVHLVIKTHPAESMRGTRESVADWIEAEYETLPDNVTLLPPQTDVDTYQLIGALDAGLVFNSTVGLEMTYFGVPVVVAGETHYRTHGFTHDPADEESYFHLLTHLGDLTMTEEMVSRAKRYTHLFFVKRHVEFPFVERSEGMDHVLNPVDHDDLDVGAEPFDTIVRSIVNGEEIFGQEFRG